VGRETFGGKKDIFFRQVDLPDYLSGKKSSTYMKKRGKGGTSARRSEFGEGSKRNRVIIFGLRKLSLGLAFLRDR